ncbi:hypothetical protein DIPPA_32632 [Diplonema papillatum]|nr:hypothetical protein DIPPA_32632 [Diplonema papillatum]
MSSAGRCEPLAEPPRFLTETDSQFAYPGFSPDHMLLRKRRHAAGKGRRAPAAGGSPTQPPEPLRQHRQPQQQQQQQPPHLHHYHHHQQQQQQDQQQQQQQQRDSPCAYDPALFTKRKTPARQPPSAAAAAAAEPAPKRGSNPRTKATPPPPPPARKPGPGLAVQPAPGADRPRPARQPADEKKKKPAKKLAATRALADSSFAPPWRVTGRFSRDRQREVDEARLRRHRTASYSPPRSGTPPARRPTSLQRETEGCAAPGLLRSRSAASVHADALPVVEVSGDARPKLVRVALNGVPRLWLKLRVADSQEASEAFLRQALGLPFDAALQFSDGNRRPAVLAHRTVTDGETLHCAVGVLSSRSPSASPGSIRCPSAACQQQPSGQNGGLHHRHHQQPPRSHKPSVQELEEFKLSNVVPAGVPTQRAAPAW